jgi:hypothetical protein
MILLLGLCVILFLFCCPVLLLGLALRAKGKRDLAQAMKELNESQSSGSDPKGPPASGVSDSR